MICYKNKKSRCRCSTSAYFSRESYEELLRFIDNGGTVAEWDRMKKSNIDKSKKSGIIKSLNKKYVKSEWDNDLPPRGQVTQKMSEDDLYDFVAKELRIPIEKATEFTDAVMSYTDIGSDIYGEVRRFQRGENLNYMSLEDIIKISDDIEDYIKKAPRWNGGETFRGVTVSDDELKTFIPGKTVEMGGTSSWSDNPKIANDFANHNISYERPNAVIYHCDTQAKGTGIRHLSVMEIESEVFCSKSAKYEVLKVISDEEGKTHIYLKEV